MLELPLEGPFFFNLMGFSLKDFSNEILSENSRRRSFSSFLSTNIQKCLTQFMLLVSFYTPENMFSDSFKGYRKRQVA